MLRVAHKVGVFGTVIAGKIPLGLGLKFEKSLLPFSPVARLHHTNGLDADPVAIQMIKYALGLARSQKSDDSYAQSFLVLEQCLSSAKVREEGGENSEGTQGTVLLAMSTLLYERGDINEAVEKLQGILGPSKSSLSLQVVAMEALIGLSLEIGQDVTSLLVAERCTELVKTSLGDGGVDNSEIDILHHQAKSIRGLAELVNGNTEKGQMFYDNSLEDTSSTGNALLNQAEFLHATGNLASAKDLYMKSIQRMQKSEEIVDHSGLSACNMIPIEGLLGATCALGQLEAHSGNFQDAEETLTKALTEAEKHFGSHHPKVGVILTCIALMFRHKAMMERSSSILIQEGLYRKAIELLKAPSLEAEDEASKVDRRDMVALARGGYAEILTVQQNRKEEGQRMKSWAEHAWTNRRLSLAEVLDISENSTKVAVVDTRISRVL
ncbi:hypothetical protein Syun_030214 [Stephania yunnanensis]|uniref:MalT-like TPR region domain-containing protein n=1 Tax=Stephania yunnanensis TaxID=152371 RepID=A0AAP0E6W6_9MAGN